MKPYRPMFMALGPFGLTERDQMSQDEERALKVLNEVFAGFVSNPPLDATKFQWRVIQAIAQALAAERVR